MAARRDVFTEIGGFDGRFVYGGDDTDLFFRAHLAGIDPYYEPGAVVARRERETMRGYLRQWYRYTVAHAQLDQKFRERGDIQRQSTTTVRAVVRGHCRELAAVGLLRSRAGRWKYAQGVAKAAGSVAGLFRYGQLS